MSKAPFSKPDVNDVVSSSHVFKIRSSLNHWSRRRLPESRGKILFGIVVIALLVLGLQLTACGNAESPLGSASPTSDTTSQSSTPTSTSASTTGPTTGPTTGQTVVPAADPKSFTVTEKELNATYAFIGTAGQQAAFDACDSDVDQPYIDVAYPDPNNPNNPKTAGPIDWSVLPSTDNGGNWLDLAPRSGSLKFGTPLRVNIEVSVPQGMPAGYYTGKIVFSPNTSGNNQDDVNLTVVPSSPTVSSISPTSGPAAGGTTVTINGSGFTGATGVSFGSSAASGFKVNCDRQITATSPAGSGTVDVTVTTSNGTSASGAADQFTYNAPPAGPTVSSISLTSGPAAGSTSVTITGTGFTGATGVSFGGTAASNFTVDSDTQITAVSPPGSGTVDVTVTTPTGTSATGAADQFTYT